MPSGRGSSDTFILRLRLIGGDVMAAVVRLPPPCSLPSLELVPSALGLGHGLCYADLASGHARIFDSPSNTRTDGAVNAGPGLW